MTKISGVSRYILIINRLRSRKQTFDQLYEYLEFQSSLKGFDCTMSLRTFQREKNQIRDIFNVDIQYNKSDKVYFVKSEENADLEVQDRLLETYQLIDIMESSQGFRDKLLFDTRKANGVEHVLSFLIAIKQSQIVHTTHFHFQSGSEYTKQIKPYFIKESQGRWYVIGEDIEKKDIRTFALDRIKEIDITNQKFKKATVNIDDWFQYSFGIIRTNHDIPQKIKLAFTYQQGQYVKSFPLHKSQIVESEDFDDDETIITLQLCPTEDFIMELLRYGNELKVLEPTKLADQIRDEHRKGYEQYNPK